MKLTRALLHDAACAVSDIAADGAYRSAFTCYRIKDLGGDAHEYAKLALACGAFNVGTSRYPQLGVFEHAVVDVAGHLSGEEVTVRANALRFDFLYLLSKAL